MRLRLVLLGSLGLLVFATLGCRRAVQASGGMEPSIKRGEKVTLDFAAYSIAAPSRWDVIAFYPSYASNEIILKRVVALPGESVAFATNGIAVNGQRLAVPSYLSNVTYVSLDQLGWPSPGSAIASPYVVPKDAFFVLGDNSTNSSDSRFCGAVPRTNIVARVRRK